MADERTSLIARMEDRPREGWGEDSRGNASWFTLFSADITPTAGMSAGIMELGPDGAGLRPHRHEQAEIYYIVDGTGLVTLAGVKSVVTAGTTVFIPGDVEHAIRNTAATVLKVFYVFPTDRFSDVVYRFPAVGPDKS